MDMHPSGVPRLVGPAGSEFSHSDFSSQFRFLPNNITNEITPPHLDSLPIRSHLQPLQLHASSSSPRLAGTQPLRLREEHSKAGSPRASSSPQHLLPSDPNPLHILPTSPSAAQKRLPHAISPRAKLMTEDMEDGDFLPVMANEGEPQTSDA